MADSKITSTMNMVANAIESATVEYREDTEIIHVQMKYGTKYIIDTNRSCYTTGSIKALEKAEKKTVVRGNQERDTISLGVGGYKNNTRIALAKFIALAVDKAEDTYKFSYVGYHCNHKDRTGNKSIYGYTNNRLYNLEITGATEDEKHWRCVERLQKVMNKHYGFSADDSELIINIECLDDDKLRTYIENEVDVLFVDSHKTNFIESRNAGFNF